jgi:hypothetical protein
VGLNVYGFVGNDGVNHFDGLGLRKVYLNYYWSNGMIDQSLLVEMQLSRLVNAGIGPLKKDTLMVRFFPRGPKSWELGKQYAAEYKPVFNYVPFTSACRERQPYAFGIAIRKDSYYQNAGNNYIRNPCGEIVNGAAVIYNDGITSTLKALADKPYDRVITTANVIAHESLFHIIGGYLDLDVPSPVTGPLASQIESPELTPYLANRLGGISSGLKKKLIKELDLK